MLEIVIFLGTAAADEDCTQVICKAKMLQSLIELLKGFFLILKPNFMAYIENFNN